MANRVRDIPENVILEHVYKDENGTEVIPFSTNVNRGQVQFAPVGRSSEMSLPIDKFLLDYTYVGPESKLAEKPKSKSASE